MSITYHILKDAGLIVSFHKGEVSDREFIAEYRSYLEDPEFNQDYSRLVDLRDAASQIRSANAIREVINLLGHHYKDKTDGPKTAIVAKEDVSFGLARMYEGFSGKLPGKIEVFRDIRKALKWLVVSIEDVKDVFEEGDFI